MKLRLLTILGVLYGVMLVYASLMPFDFVAGEHIGHKIHRFWGGWPIDPSARISGSDVVSNLALYVPLGWLITVRCRLGRVSIYLSLMIAVLACSTVSACVELAQITTLSRTSSAADWLLNTISGCAGATAGAVCGKGLWVSGIRWLRRCWNTRPVDIATLALMGLLAADALAPYIPTILLKQVWHSLKRSHFDIVGGLALHPWHWWVVTRVMVYAVLTMLLDAWGGRKPGLKRWNRAAAMAACFALSLELAKPMIVSRTINVANVATSWSGCLVAVLIGAFFAGRMVTDRKLELAISALLMYVFYLWWIPFNFVWDPELFRKEVPSPVELLPLYHYAMGAKLNHARLFVQSVCLQGILVYLLRLRFGWFEGAHTGIALAAISAGALGLLLEGGQIFLPSRTPSVTDMYCFALGGVLGAWIRRPTHALPANREFFPQSESAI
jgi:VanZ family protein